MSAGLKRVVVALSATILTMAVLAVLWFTGHMGGEPGPTPPGWIGLIIVVPPFTIADALGFGDLDRVRDVFIIGSITFLQMFLAYWLFLLLWKRFLLACYRSMETQQ